MISLLQYIFETVLSNDLSKEFKIEEISDNEANKLLEGINGFEKLGANDMSDIMFWENSIHYKMIYKNKCLGLFALCDFNQNIEGDYERFLIKLFYKIFNDYQNFIKSSIYVTYLIMVSDNQKELDISPIATIKVFFDKLKDICKKQKKEYIFAHGKDERITRLYCKCGGFKYLKDFYTEKDIQWANILSLDDSLDNALMYSLSNKYSEFKK